MTTSAHLNVIPALIATVTVVPVGDVDDRAECRVKRCGMTSETLQMGRNGRPAPALTRWAKGTRCGPMSLRRMRWIPLAADLIPGQDMTTNTPQAVIERITVDRLALETLIAQHVPTGRVGEWCVRLQGRGYAAPDGPLREHTTSERLQQAAAAIREAALASMDPASRLRWAAGEADSFKERHPEDAALIALMGNPPVALAVADWLTVTADRVDLHNNNRTDTDAPYDLDSARTVVDRVLGPNAMSSGQ